MEFLVLVIFVILEHLKKRQIMFRMYKFFKKKKGKKGLVASALLLLSY